MPRLRPLCDLGAEEGEGEAMTAAPPPESPPTGHMGNRIDNYCTWCEAYVDGREAAATEIEALRRVERAARETLQHPESLVKHVRRGPLVPTESVER